MKIAIRSGITPGETLPEQMAWAERAGLDGIELEGAALALPTDDVRAIAGGSPVAIASIDGAPRLLSADPAERQAAKEEIRRRLDLAAMLGAVGVLIVPQVGRGPALPDLSPYKTAADLERELLIAQLRELAPAARAAGARLFLEPLNRYEAYIVNRLEQGVAIAEEIGPEIGIMADFFHMQIEETDLAASIHTAGERIVHVHVADSNRLQPGRGHLDFGPGFAALKTTGYDGWLGIECRIAGPIDEAIRESVALLRHWWDAA